MEFKNARITELHDKYGTSIAVVDLSALVISNEDLRHVKTLNPNYEIDLSDTSIDDNGLVYLAGLSVSKVDLSGTQVSIEGVKRLRSSLPSDAVVISDFE